MFNDSGIYFWRLPTLDNDGIKHSTSTFVPSSGTEISGVPLLDYVRDVIRPTSALCRAVDVLSMSPQGRLFCTILSPGKKDALMIVSAKLLHSIQIDR